MQQKRSKIYNVDQIHNADPIHNVDPSSCNDASAIDGLAVVAKRNKKRALFLPTEPIMMHWDMIKAIMLFFTALITPFEMAFLETSINGLFVINRIVDLGFFLDIVVNFNLAFITKDGTLIDNVVEIRRHYARTWFPIDVVSTVPYDLIVYEMQSSGDTNESENTLVMLRMLKLLKLTKLLRIMKSVSVFRNITAMLNLTNAMTDLMFYFIIVLITMHWGACFWRMVPDFLSYRRTWITEVQLDHLDVTGEIVKDPSTLFAYSFEFSLMSLVMGYGSVEPANMGERGCAIILMVVSGTVYTYVIGGVCGILATRDPVTAAFRGNMDLLSYYIQEHNFPIELSIQMKQYFRYCQEIFRCQMYSDVTHMLAPTLQAKAAAHANAKVLAKLSFMRAEDVNEREKFMVRLGTLLQFAAFPPVDVIYRKGEHATKLYVIQKGILRNGAAFITNQQGYFGEEMLLPDARRPCSCVTVNYCYLRTLERSELKDLLSEHHRSFPQTIKLLRKMTARTMLRKIISALGRSSLVLQELKGTRFSRPQLQAYRRMILLKGALPEANLTLDCQKAQRQRAVSEARAKAKAKAARANGSVVDEAEEAAREVRYWCSVAEGRKDAAAQIIPPQLHIDYHKIRRNSLFGGMREYHEEHSELHALHPENNKDNGDGDGHGDGHGWGWGGGGGGGGGGGRDTPPSRSGSKSPSTPSGSGSQQLSSASAARAGYGKGARRGGNTIQHKKQPSKQPSKHRKKSQRQFASKGSGSGSVTAATPGHDRDRTHVSMQQAQEGGAQLQEGTEREREREREEGAEGEVEAGGFEAEAPVSTSMSESMSESMSARVIDRLGKLEDSIEKMALQLADANSYARIAYGMQKDSEIQTTKLRSDLRKMMKLLAAGAGAHEGGSDLSLSSSSMSIGSSAAPSNNDNSERE